MPLNKHFSPGVVIDPVNHKNCMERKHFLQSMPPSHSLCNYTYRYQLQGMVQHDRQQQDPYERTVHKDHFGHNGSMYDRFFGTAECSSDAVFPVEMQQAGNVADNKKYKEKQGQHTGAQ
jgi:hypothetical protein